MIHVEGTVVLNDREITSFSVDEDGAGVRYLDGSGAWLSRRLIALLQNAIEIAAREASSSEDRSEEP